MARKKRKIRVAFQKNRQKNPQKPDLTRRVLKEGIDAADVPSEERVRGRRGDLTRYRTIIGEEDATGELLRAVDDPDCLMGRVLIARGAQCIVRSDDGRRFECAVRRVVRTLARDERTAVVAGDRVLFRPVSEEQGVIERVEPRHGTISRGAKRRRHVIVSNVDQLLIVASAVDPPLKTNLIDRYLISAEVGGVDAIICINKTDLVEPASLMPVVGLYAQLGYDVVLASAESGAGIPRLRNLLKDRASALSGQSGVGKSSLLNAVQPGLELKTGEVSEESRKGRHTTTSASLLELEFGGWVVDTPGIRQMELWDVHPEEVAGYFPEFRPFFPRCRFPDCTHSHEQSCGIKHAVSHGLISLSRYESYLKILRGEQE